MEKKGTQDKVKIIEEIKTLEIKSYLRDSDELLKKSGYTREEIIDCSLGVNPFGCSKYIEEEIKNINWKNINMYPSPNYMDIRNGIINYWSDTKKIDNEQLQLGFGAIGVMSTLLRLFCQKNTRTLGLVPQFNEFENLVKIKGGKYEYIYLKNKSNYKFNIDEMLNSIRGNQDIVYIDNPNNPTGQIIDLKDIEKLGDRTSKFKIPLIIDEAYGDFMPKKNSAINLVDKYSNIMVIKSFSKGFGLANIRLGYLVTTKEISWQYEKVNIPVFVFPDIFQNLVCTSLEDKDFLDMSIRGILKNKVKFISELESTFDILDTSYTVPILTLGVDRNINLREKLLELGIISCDGGDFNGLGSNYVRLRIPRSVDTLIYRMKNFNIK